MIYNMMISLLTTLTILYTHNIDIIITIPYLYHVQYFQSTTTIAIAMFSQLPDLRWTSLGRCAKLAEHLN